MSAIQLEAWRDGTDMDGRHYTITYVITDNAGNQSTASTTVLVPHDNTLRFMMLNHRIKAGNSPPFFSNTLLTQQAEVLYKQRSDIDPFRFAGVAQW